MGGTATAGTGYVRVVRPAAGLTVRGEFRLMTGLLLGMPAATFAVLAAQGEVSWWAPAVLAAAGAAGMADLSRVNRGPEARVAESLEGGELEVLLADLQTGATGPAAFRRVLDGGFGFRRGRFTGGEIDRPEGWLAWEWMAAIDAGAGVREAEEAAAKGDPPREFDGTPYLPYLRFARDYGEWLRAAGYRDDGDYNPFRGVLHASGRLVVDAGLQ